MDRFLLPVLVVAADVALFAARTPPGWALVAYAAAAIVVCAAAKRWPPAGFAAAVVLAAVTGGAFVVLMWTAYLAGRSTRSRPVLAALAGVGLAGLAVRAAQLRTVPQLVVAFLVFVALPMLVGRYLAGQDEERLRLARDVHDSLGRRLSLVSIQAAALEVGSAQGVSQPAVSQLAAEVRAAIDDLHDLVGTLRRTAPPEIDTVVAAFRRAGVAVAVHRRGRPGQLSTMVAEASCRVVAEGLTNAVRHAPGQPVTVELTWESDALLVSVTNALSGVPAAAGRSAVAGSGLVGLRERCLAAGGALDHRLTGDGFRLFAMLPVRSRRRSHVAVGVAVVVLMFVVLPAGLLVGAR